MGRSSLLLFYLNRYNNSRIALSKAFFLKFVEIGRAIFCAIFEIFSKPIFDWVYAQQCFWVVFLCSDGFRRAGQTGSSIQLVLLLWFDRAGQAWSAVRYGIVGPWIHVAWAICVWCSAGPCGLALFGRARVMVF